MTQIPWVLSAAALFFSMYLIALLVEYVRKGQEKQRLAQLQKRKLQLIQDIIWMCQERVEKHLDHGPYVVYFPMDDCEILDEPYCPVISDKTVRDRILSLQNVQCITVGNVYSVSVGGVHL